MRICLKARRGRFAARSLKYARYAFNRAPRGRTLSLKNIEFFIDGYKTLKREDNLMYEEILQPKKPKWYHGIFFCAALILAILAVLFVIQLLKNIFKEANAVIFDLLGIASMAVMVWFILSKRTSLYRYTLSQEEFSAEKYTGQRMVRRICVPISAITGIVAVEPQSREKYESYICQPDQGDFILNFELEGQKQGIIIAPSDKLRTLLEEKMKGMNQSCAKQTE